MFPFAECLRLGCCWIRFSEGEAAAGRIECEGISVKWWEKSVKVLNIWGQNRGNLGLSMCQEAGNTCHRHSRTISGERAMDYISEYPSGIYSEIQGSGLWQAPCSNLKAKHVQLSLKALGHMFNPLGRHHPFFWDMEDGMNISWTGNWTSEWKIQADVGWWG